MSDGWKPILDTFSAYLDEKYGDKRRYVDTKDGEKTHDHSWKEKYGELVIDFRAGFDGEDNAIADFCEELSTRICDECGRPGKSRDLPWIRTLCDEHWKERLR